MGFFLNERTGEIKGSCFYQCSLMSCSFPPISHIFILNVIHVNRHSMHSTEGNEINVFKWLKLMNLTSPGRGFACK